jgi:threonine dehydrogenase-like Zn-dependent dehydrogenase
MFETGAIKAQPMISHSFTLEDYAQALRMFRAGQGRKLQLRPNQDTSQGLLGQRR